jgi:peptide/nickel transport system permease protein
VKYEHYHDADEPPLVEPGLMQAYAAEAAAEVGGGGGLALPMDVTERQEPSRTLWGDALRRLRRNRLAMVSVVWILIISFIAITAGLWVPRVLGSPTEIDSTLLGTSYLQPPTLAHPFGTDDLGRDVLARTIYGARVSLTVGVIATAISIVIGLLLGAVAAFYKGISDSFIMRLADVFLAFPYILFAIALIAVMGRGFINVFIAIGILGWPTIARIFRSSALSVQENEYVDAARALGASDRRIVARHVLPNSMAPIIVYGTMTIGGAILTEAALSFLGMGVQPPQASWGLMLSDARNFMFTAPWLMIFPGFAILTTVLAFVLLGDGLRDALDVKMAE